MQDIFPRSPVAAGFFYENLAYRGFFSKKPTSKIKWLAPKIYCFNQFALSNNPVEPCNIYQKPTVKVAVTSDFADMKIANILTAASVFLLCKDAAILSHERLQ